MVNIIQEKNNVSMVSLSGLKVALKDGQGLYMCYKEQVTMEYFTLTAPVDVVQGR